MANHQELDERYRTSWGEVEKLVQHMNKDWNILSISDIVLNHTANESSWIHEHPESTYNCQNTPNLRPAFLLDQMFVQVTKGILNQQKMFKNMPGIAITIGVGIKKSFKLSNYTSSFPSNKRCHVIREYQAF